MDIRMATREDAGSLSAIYEQYMSTAVTFEYETVSLAEFELRIINTLKDYPFLVGLANGRIVGYAYAHRIQTRDAYQWGAELSVYLDRAAYGRGYGTQLYLRLIEILQMQGVRTVYGCVTTPNPASEHLHEKLGFKRIGYFKNAGFKNGKWHDITWFGKSIGEYNVPMPFIPFRSLPRF